MALRGLIPLLREQLVGYALLHVVGFAREDQEGLVLRLPPEPGDRAVVTVPVLATGNAKELLSQRLGSFIRDDRAFVDGLDQARAKHRRGDPEDQVVLCGRCGKVRLGENAARRVVSTGDGE